MSTLNNIQGRRPYVPAPIRPPVNALLHKTYHASDPQPRQTEPLALIAAWLGDTARKLRNLMRTICGVNTLCIVGGLVLILLVLA